MTITGWNEVRPAAFDRACEPSAALAALDVAEWRDLYAAARRFVAGREWYTAEGWQPDDDEFAELQWRIAAEATLMVLKLDAALFDDVATIILYPSGFMATGSYTDEDGIEHRISEPRSGEAWEQGPVVLAADDVLDPPPGTSLVIHEFAHKLDALNGRMNGFPPMPAHMSPARWSDVFQHAWDRLDALDDAGAALPVDDYALENPAEFFAVMCESFFIEPLNLRRSLPEVYALLSEWFSQDPAARVEA
ncbi:MAG: hypothetical protein CSB44_08090 [Gammaproteobacteria bacterium]|nr:MAG: hypothetical protein CSB44_08090 [Gammaproteobacteria bacterium]PIE36884.1 MAG: hypothetical protein CSA54_02830 [Gammaproteobacteria bacterium]